MKHRELSLGIPQSSSFHADKAMVAYREKVLSAVAVDFFSVDSTAPVCRLDDVTFVCFTNRCGSNYLAEVLKSTGIFDNKGEAFNWNRIQSECERKGVHAFNDYVRDVLSPRKGKKALIKIGWPQLMFLEREGFLEKHFCSPKYIWVRRRDFVSQAVSLYIARATGKWTSRQGDIADLEIAYDFQAIARNVYDIFRGNEYIYKNIVYSQKPFMEVCYEDFCESMDFYVARVFGFLGMPNSSPPNPELVGVKVQRNKLNVDFRQRFLADVFSEKDAQA